MFPVVKSRLVACRNFLAMCTMVAVTSIAAAPFAAAQVTLPATGVDVGEWITASITALAAVVAVAVGGFFAFLVIRMALRWARVAK